MRHNLRIPPDFFLQKLRTDVRTAFFAAHDGFFKVVLERQVLRLMPSVLQIEQLRLHRTQPLALSILLALLLSAITFPFLYHILQLLDPLLHFDIIFALLALRISLQQHPLSRSLPLGIMHATAEQAIGSAHLPPVSLESAEQFLPSHNL